MAMVSQSFSISLMTWVEKITVLPRARHSRMKADDGAGGQHVQPVRRLVENHHRRVVDERAGDGDFLFHAAGKLVAAAVAKFIHVQRGKKSVQSRAQHAVAASHAGVRSIPPIRGR